MIIEMVGSEEIGGVSYPIVADSLGNLITLVGEGSTRSVCLSTWSPQTVSRETIEWTWQTSMTCVGFEFSLFRTARGGFGLLTGCLP